MIGRITAALELLLALAAPVRAEEPWSVDPRHPVVFAPSTRAFRPAPAAQVSDSDPFGLAYLLYTDRLTAIDGPRCAHRPSCGAFAAVAIKRYGLPVGAWMAMGRLLRGAQSSALRALPLIAAPGGVFFLDRLEDNAFWEDSYRLPSGR